MKSTKQKSQPKKYITSKEKYYKPKPLVYKEPYHNITSESENAMNKNIIQTKINRENASPFIKIDKDCSQIKLKIAKAEYPKELSKKQEKKKKNKEDNKNGKSNKNSNQKNIEQKKDIY